MYYMYVLIQTPLSWRFAQKRCFLQSLMTNSFDKSNQNVEQYMMHKLSFRKKNYKGIEFSNFRVFTLILRMFWPKM